MTEEKTQNGLMEAFSFRKSVVKISGKWIRFGPELEVSVKRLSVGDAVAYVVSNGNMIRIEKVQGKQSATLPVSTKVQPAPAGDTRNRSIERQVALKAAVELAGLYGYMSTRECLGVAASFANWIEGGSQEDIQLPPNGHEGKAASSPSSSS